MAKNSGMLRHTKIFLEMETSQCKFVIPYDQTKRSKTMKLHVCLPEKLS